MCFGGAGQLGDREGRNFSQQFLSPFSSSEQFLSLASTSLLFFFLALFKGLTHVLQLFFLIFKGFIHFFKDLYHLHNVCLGSYPCI